MVSLENTRIESRYIQIIKYIYNNDTSTSQFNNNMISIKVERGIKEGDNLSPKLFTLDLKDVFQHNKGIVINGKRLKYLRYADDIVLISDNNETFEKILKTQYGY